MAREGTFQNHLEKLLGVAGADANVSQRLLLGAQEVMDRRVEETLEYALVGLMDRKSARDYQEDFIIDGLPNTSRLNTPVDVVQAAKEFYSARGFKSQREHIFRKGWEEIHVFDDGKEEMRVQFDIGSGFGKQPGKYELWVTIESLGYK